MNLKKPDIIIVDYIMPKMNGLEFIKKFRSFDRKVPIILITAASDEAIKLKALESGATEFLYLPFNKYEFIMRVRNLLELRKYQRRVENKAMVLAHEIKEATKSITEREKETLEVHGWRDRPRRRRRCRLEAPKHKKTGGARHGSSCKKS